MTSPIEAGFAAAGIPVDLYSELLASYREAKQRYHRRDLRPTEVEGGRFSEAAFRMLEWEANGSHTAIGSNLPGTPTLVSELAKKTSAPDSVRFHIPRTLQAVYDIRNKRDVAHLGKIDANLQDASLVVHILDWVVAEFVRLYHNVSDADAERMISDIVKKEVPAIQVIDGFPLILKAVPLVDRILILLYWHGDGGTSKSLLSSWLTVNQRSNLSAVMKKLRGDIRVYLSGDVYHLTDIGIADVEARDLLAPVA
ncbi:hypothetical protein BH93_21040 [Rhodococcoides fascians A25f]|uniref:hypothetical protein n=1 Tax=Rhodococcoides fascians TaxID=1828 RepID=UPI0012D30E10|nr:hypothetical protein [Rhodococcus fascians]QII07529.1 hypothetical protein BH93_21040 [Rhodococcus fascians A25f]